MIEVWNALDNREKALLVWTFIIVLATLSKRELRSSFAAVLGALIVWPLSGLLLGAALYVVTIVLLGAAVGVWTLALLGVTVLWCFGPGALMFFNSNDAVSDPHYLRKVLRGTFTLILIVEFLVNVYVFNLLVELILLPVLTVLVLTAYVASTKDEFAPAKRFLDVLLAIFGIALLVRSLALLTLDFESFVTVENLMRLVYPLALTIAFLPYAYFLRLYIRREQRRLYRDRRRRLVAG
jgi:hypothetical protein